jgi:hypothetical protein
VAARTIHGIQPAAGAADRDVPGTDRAASENSGSGLLRQTFRNAIVAIREKAEEMTSVRANPRYELAARE